MNHSHSENFLTFSQVPTGLIHQQHCVGNHHQLSRNHQSLPPIDSFVPAQNSQLSSHLLPQQQDFNIQELLTNNPNDLENAYNDEGLFDGAFNQFPENFDPSSFLTDTSVNSQILSNDHYYNSNNAVAVAPNLESQPNVQESSEVNHNSLNNIFSGDFLSSFGLAEDERILEAEDRYCPQGTQSIQSQEQHLEIPPPVTNHINNNQTQSQVSEINHEHLHLTCPTPHSIPTNSHSNHGFSESLQTQISGRSIAPQQAHSQLNESRIINGEVNTLPVTDLIEESKCYKCKVCDYLSLEKTKVYKHIEESHKDPEIVMNKNKTGNSTENTTMTKTQHDKTYMCSQCFNGFPSLAACSLHMKSEHNIDQVTLQSVPEKQQANITKNGNYQRKENKTGEIVNINGQNKISKLRQILPNGEITSTVSGTSKRSRKLLLAAKSQNNNSHPINSKKIAWRKKLKREQGTYICEFKGCSMRFKTTENLNYHHKSHSDSGTGFTCCECGFKSEQWSSIAGHLWREHSIDMELHACESCSYRTYSLSVLENVHKKIHSNERNHLCDTCGKGFKNHKQLINHRVSSC